MLRSRSTSEIEIRHEFAILIGLSLVLIVAIYVWPTSAVRTILGLLYVLFAPGYSLVAALFPGTDGPSYDERIGLGFGLSIAVACLIGLLLDSTSWGIRLELVLISLALLILVCSGIASYRRSKLLPEKRFAIRLEFDVSRWRAMGWLDKALSVLLALSIVAVVVAFAYVIAKPKVGERFTEFYILGPDGMAAGYPAQVIVGEPIALTVGIVNREHRDELYRVEREGEGNKEQVAIVQLAHNETREQPYTFALNEPGANRRVTFLLYKGDEPEPYRSLHFWITVGAK